MADVIACDLYDYFEIACMRRDFIELQMQNGEIFRGTAVDLQTKDGREWLHLDRKNLSQLQVNLREIQVLVFPKTGQSIKITE